MLEAMVCVDQPDYAYIVNLDKAVRDFRGPTLLDESKPHGVSPRFLVMQQGIVVMSREIGASLPLGLRYVWMSVELRFSMLTSFRCSPASTTSEVLYGGYERP